MAATMFRFPQIHLLQLCLTGQNFPCRSYPIYLLRRFNADLSSRWINIYISTRSRHSSTPNTDSSTCRVARNHAYHILITRLFHALYDNHSAWLIESGENATYHLVNVTMSVEVVSSHAHRSSDIGQLHS
jgi:hypothetical protein